MSEAPEMHLSEQYDAFLADEPHAQQSIMLAINDDHRNNNQNNNKNSNNNNN